MVYMCVYTYVYIYIYSMYIAYIYIYIHIYIYTHMGKYKDYPIFNWLINIDDVSIHWYMSLLHSFLCLDVYG